MFRTWSIILPTVVLNLPRLPQVQTMCLSCYMYMAPLVRYLPWLVYSVFYIAAVLRPARSVSLIEEGGDWDRRNRLKVYQGVYLMAVRDFKAAAQLFLDTISTFTSYELMDYVTFVKYTVYSSVIALPRQDLRKKVGGSTGDGWARQGAARAAGSWMWWLFVSLSVSDLSSVITYSDSLLQAAG